MWYIYEENENVIFSKVKPSKKHFTIDKIPPKPNQKYLELKADFKHEMVWWGKRELTQEEQKQERIIEIQNELKELDDIIKRPLEDVIEKLHIEFGYMPYTTTAEVINRKEDLRDELEQLNGTGGAK